MSKGVRFRPLGWLTAIATLGAMLGVTLAAAPSGAATERSIELRYKAECVLAPGVFNKTGEVEIVQRGSVPESLAPGEDATLEGNTLTVITPAAWGESLYAFGARTASGLVKSATLDLTGAEPAKLQIATPPEFAGGLPFETKIEDGPVSFTAPTGSEAHGLTSFDVGPVKVTGKENEVVNATLDAAPGFRELTTNSYESTGEGIQYETTGYDEAGKLAIGPVTISCTAPANTTVFELPIKNSVSSISSTSSTTTSDTSSAATSPTATSTTSPTTTTTSPTTATTTASSSATPTTTTTSTSSAPGAPQVTRVRPAAGPTFGFTAVLIEGSNLSPAAGTCRFFDCRGATVQFGAAEAFLLFASPERDLVFSPAHAAGTVDVTVTVNGETSATSPADRFTYSGSGGFPCLRGFAAGGNRGDGDSRGRGDPPRFAAGHRHHHDR